MSNTKRTKATGVGSTMHDVDRPSRSESVHIPTDRPERIPVAGFRSKLEVFGLDTENYIHRWVKDVPGRLAQFELGWWEYVDKKDVTVGHRTVDKATEIGSSLVSYPAGQGEVLYLMRIAKEYYDEDQKAKANKLAMSEEQIYEAAKSKIGADESLSKLVQSSELR